MINIWMVNLMTYRQSKKLEKREGIWHYSEYKKRKRICDKICNRIDSTDAENAVKLIFKDFVYTDIFRKDSRIIFRNQYRFIDSVTFLKAVTDFWLKTDFATIQRQLNNIPDFITDEEISFSIHKIGE